MFVLEGGQCVCLGIRKHDLRVRSCVQKQSTSKPSPLEVLVPTTRKGARLECGRLLLNTIHVCV